jgi:hypothetical protein
MESLAPSRSGGLSLRKLRLACGYNVPHGVGPADKHGVSLLDGSEPGRCRHGAGWPEVGRPWPRRRGGRAGPELQSLTASLSLCVACCFQVRLIEERAVLRAGVGRGLKHDIDRTRGQFRGRMRSQQQQSVVGRAARSCSTSVTMFTLQRCGLM